MWVVGWLQRPLAASQPERGSIWQSAACLRPAAHLVTPGYTSEARESQKNIWFHPPSRAIRLICWSLWPAVEESLHRCVPPPPTLPPVICVGLVPITVYWKNPPGQEQRS